MPYELDADKVIEKALEAIKENLQTNPVYAEMIVNQLLRASPNHPVGLHLLSLLKQQTQQYEESIYLAKKAIEIDPSNPDNYNNIALAYANLDKYDDAIEYLNKAIAIKPSYLYLNNLALQYRTLRQYDKAIELLKRALNIQEAPQVWNNLGGVFGECKNIEKARKCFLRAIELDPNFAAAHVDLAFSYHLSKEWAKGFEEYEWRFAFFKQLEFYKKAYDQTKKWDGSDPTGKTFVLYGEQGVGDSLQFIRYVKFLKQRGAAKIIVHVPEPIATLVGRIEGVDEVFVGDIVSKNATLSDYDLHCSLMSLPHLLKVYEINGSPYVKALATLKVKEQKEYKDTFNIGIMWAGSPAHPNDLTRSMHLKYFKPIHDIPGVKLFNLQVNYQKRCYSNNKKLVDFCDGCDDMRIVDMTQMIQHYDDTATIITGLDLVISVDTSIVHLAGALGVPCWMLVPYNPDWRWGFDGETTGWYDSLRLFRQEIWGDWSRVMERVKNEVLLQIK